MCIAKIIENVSINHASHDVIVFAQNKPALCEPLYEQRGTYCRTYVGMK